jgi:hypothetical protein
MDVSLIQLIAEARASARCRGIAPCEERAAVEAVLLARDSTLRPGTARVLVDQLYPILERTMGR